jgi:PKD repeat protein
VGFNGAFTDHDLQAPSLAGESIHWGFGDEVTSTGTLTPSHTYSDNGTYTVTLTVTDTAGGRGSDWLLVNVENVSPTLGTLPYLSVTVGESLTVTTSFNDPGTADTHTASINWGDGTTEAGVVDQGAGSVRGTHAYTGEGTYTVIFSITDDDGGKGERSFVLNVSERIIYLPIINR